MGNRYHDLRERQQKRVDQLFKGTVFFAFNQRQLEEGMKEIGARFTSELYSLGGSGGYYKKSDAPKIRQLFADLAAERAEAFRNGGAEFAKEAFLEEMANHEYGYTYDLDPVFDALGFTADEVSGTPYLAEGLKMAINSYRDCMEVKE